MVCAVTVGIALAVAPGGAGWAAAPDCVAARPGAPVTVTPDCVDPRYADPVIDREQDLSAPIAHRRVSGHFDGTDVKFTIYLPRAAQWRGRFFQYTDPLADENALDRVVAFGAATGGYTVQTSGTPGYRHAAAAAKFARKVAAVYYRSGSRRIYGYLYGPSGGPLQAIGAIENTTGVWDGAVPIALGVPAAIPADVLVRAQARMVLSDVAERIADAVRPGGSGDPYAGLTLAQDEVLREVTRLGIPRRAWEDPVYVQGLSTTDDLLGFSAVIRELDPTYVTDFWSAPGYLGTERSGLGGLVRAALIDVKPRVAQVKTDEQGMATAVTLSGLPTLTSAMGLDFVVLAPDRTTQIGTLHGALDPATGVFTVGSGNSAAVLAALRVGARIHVDNRWFVALPSYYRHQVPPADLGDTSFDVLRGPDGEPRYPQRAPLVGPVIASSTAGSSNYTGAITGKVIVVANLLDADAFPWHADWYANRVRAALGARAFEDSFRLYYNDNADHLQGPVTGDKASRIVSCEPSVEQALRDVAAWVERGTAPPQSTNYRVDHGQVTVPAQASERRGIQPVVDLAVYGRDQVTVKAGQMVEFSAQVEAPPDAGRVVSAGWDYTGAGTFTPIVVEKSISALTIAGRYQYTTPGTYYVAFRAASSRSAAAQRFAQVENLDRVRVDVVP